LTEEVTPQSSPASLARKLGSTDRDCRCYDERVPASSARSAPVITVINLKGGVAKTFTAWTIAGVYNERGKRVLVIDCDAQGNLTGSFLSGLGDQPGIEALFDPAAEPMPPHSCAGRNLRTSI
jgi:Mrp family chromosome partitioning ATPase